MAEMTITQELRAAAAGLKAAEAAREEAEQAFLAARERREAAEMRSPERVGGGECHDAAEWRAAYDEDAFARHQETKFAETLEAAKALEADCRERVKAAERRNLVATRSAIVGKLARLGAEVVRELVKLKDLDRQIGGHRPGQMTVSLAVKFGGVLAYQLKLAGLNGSLSSDPLGLDWAGFGVWAEKLLRGHVVPDVPRPSARMLEAEALDRIEDEEAAVVPALRPVPAAMVGGHDYSILPPVEAD